MFSLETRETTQQPLMVQENMGESRQLGQPCLVAGCLLISSTNLGSLSRALPCHSYLPTTYKDLTVFPGVAFPAQLESQKVTPACLPWYLLSFSGMFGGR